MSKSEPMSDGQVTLIFLGCLALFLLGVFLLIMSIDGNEFNEAPDGCFVHEQTNAKVYADDTTTTTMLCPVE